MAEWLAGGNMNEVERVGDTVLRTAGPWTPTIHRLLAHVRAAGVDWVPEPIGTTPDGREMLSFLEGTVPLYPLPEWVWADSVLVESARMLRQFHEATAGFPFEAAIWQLPARGPVEVVCHNDFAPHNLVFCDGRVVGAIDFDTCAPGPRLWDLAYLATRAVPLSRFNDAGARDESDAIRRLRLLLAAYGSAESTGDLVDVAIERLDDLAAYSERKAVELARQPLAEHAAHYRLEAAHLRATMAEGP